MIEFTEQQRQALQSLGDVAPTVLETNTHYVLVRKDLYERLKSILDDDSAIGEEEFRLMLARSSEANGWDEPGMEVYDRYDEERRKP